MGIIDDELKKQADDDTPKLPEQPKEEYVDVINGPEFSMHKIYQDLLKQPMPKGECREIIGGHVIDVHDMGDFNVFKQSPSLITDIVDSTIAGVRAETFGKTKRKPFRLGSGIIIIILLIVVLIIGAILLTKGPEIATFFKSMFGGMI